MSRPRSPKRLVAAACTALILGSVAAIPVATSTASDASAVQEPFWTWNIYGTCGNSGNCGDWLPAQVLHYLIVAEPNRPWSVTLQEVCRKQFNYLYSQLVPLGYTLDFTKTNGTAGNGTSQPSPVAGHPFSNVNCGAVTPDEAEFGNATLLLGSWTGVTNRLYYPAQLPGGDVRAITCIQMATYVGERFTCNTHIDDSRSAGGSPQNPVQVARDQDDTASYIAAVANSQGKRILVGGDRNMTQWRSWPGFGFTEIDIQPTALQRTHSCLNNATPGDTLDWIFGGAGHGAVGPAQIYDPPYYSPTLNISDHCMVKEQFNV